MPSRERVMRALIGEPTRGGKYASRAPPRTRPCERTARHRRLRRTGGKQLTMGYKSSYEELTKIWQGVRCRVMW